MADQLLDKVRQAAEGQIDFKGQELAELMATALLVIVGAVAFTVGYIQQDIKLALYIGLGGTAITFIAVVPPWPFFVKNPIKWLPAAGGKTVPENTIVDMKVG